MALKELIKRNRSYRRFDENKLVNQSQLIDLIDLARLSASASNRQPLKYFLSNQPEINEKIFGTLGWAGYLADWIGPAKGERPTAYIVLLGDHMITENFGVDPGIAAQSILLGATEKGLGGCMFGSVARETLGKLLRISPQYEILYVLALGFPIEKVQIEEVGSDGNIQYWRDHNQVHHVPKRSLSEIVVS
ncbi:MAG: nitroreductase family protein [Candidatus Atribacteria bacterium]|nr:nitroreductase family protein [Candidatus Atribacteria bacterium]